MNILHLPNATELHGNVELIAQGARRLIDGTSPGVLTTLDDRGYPHARWMATLDSEGFPLIYTLTGPASRKIRHISLDPKVSWMFADPTMTLVINLFGTARVVSEMDTIQQVWKRVVDKSHAYFLRKFGGSEGCAVLETAVARIEYTLPERNITEELAVDFVAGKSKMWREWS